MLPFTIQTFMIFPTPHHLFWAILPSVILPVVLVLGPVTPAPAQGMPDPTEAQRRLQELRELREKREESLRNERVQIRRALIEAARDGRRAQELYEDAVRETQFAGLTREGTAFRDWRSDNAERLRSRDFHAALQFHLNYLVLTLDKAADRDMAELGPQVMAYAEELRPRSNLESEHRDLLRRPITNSIFVRWLGLERMLQGVQDWEMSPGDIDGIYQKSLLPWMRERGDQRVFQYWDERLRTAREQVDGGTEFAHEQFRYVEAPRILWNRAQEYLHFNQPGRAISAMFSIMQDYPQHPDFNAWYGQVEELLTEGNDS